MRKAGASAMNGCAGMQERLLEKSMFVKKTSF